MSDRAYSRLAAIALGAAFLVPSAQGAAETGRSGAVNAPPPAIRDDGASIDALAGSKAAATKEYSHGDPTDEEQFFMELMNRARANPEAEADRVFADYGHPTVTGNVDFFLTVTKRGPPGEEITGTEWTRQENHDAFDSYPVQPPFAFNADASEAAREHSRQMKAAQLQTHQVKDVQGVPDEPGLRTRMENAGYFGNSLAESVFAFAEDMLHAHAGFAIDWGQAFDPVTLRPMLGHRTSLMNQNDDPGRQYREVGVGVIADNRAGSKVGPLLITIDFAKPLDDNQMFVTGVVFDDVNGNDLYDIGEGLAGARIETDVSDFFAVSSTSGGYSIPVARNSGQVVVTLTGEAGTPSESLGMQQDIVQVTNANVKVDFGPPPDPPLTAYHEVAGAAMSLSDGFSGNAAIAVGALDPASKTIGDIDVKVTLTHADRRELTVSLESPNGTMVTLFDGGTGGADLAGSFDGTLHPVEPLAAFVGEAYAGTWRLHVTETGGGTDGGTLDAVTLCIRPEWVRPLHAPASGLAITALKLKDSADDRRDKLIVKGFLDAQGERIDAAEGGALRLLDPGSGAELFAVAVDVVAPAAKGAIDPDAAVKAKLKINNKDTSRTLFVLKASNVNLPAPLPPAVRVELAIGGAIASEDVPLTAGKFVSAKTAPLTHLLFLDKVKSTPGPGDATTVIKGRIAAPGGIGLISGAVELAVGDARFGIRSENLTVKGSKLIFKAGSGLRKLVVDTLKGTFTAKVTSADAILDDDKIAVELRLGDAFFGRASVRPRDANGKTVY